MGARSKERVRALCTWYLQSCNGGKEPYVGTTLRVTPCPRSIGFSTFLQTFYKLLSYILSIKRCLCALILAGYLCSCTTTQPIYINPGQKRLNLFFGSSFLDLPALNTTILISSTHHNGSSTNHTRFVRRNDTNDEVSLIFDRSWY